jgi:cytochrome c biogenesis protein ResB
MPTHAAAAGSAQFEVSQGYGPVITLVIVLLVIGMVSSAVARSRRARTRSKRNQ